MSGRLPFRVQLSHHQVIEPDAVVGEEVSCGRIVQEVLYRTLPVVLIVIACELFCICVIDPGTVNLRDFLKEAIGLNIEDFDN